jgi:hypothetical protein
MFSLFYYVLPYKSGTLLDGDFASFMRNKYWHTKICRKPYLFLCWKWEKEMKLLHNSKSKYSFYVSFFISAKAQTYYKVLLLGFRDREETPV